MKIVIGAGPSKPAEGWTNTDVRDTWGSEILNAVDQESWDKFLNGRKLDRILMEHVAEHWTPEQFKGFLCAAHAALVNKGVIRIAVPDGYHPEEYYKKIITPPNHGHKVVFTIESLVSILESENYKVSLLQYFDAQGNFHENEAIYDEEYGQIIRRKGFGWKNKENPLYITSIIVDAEKQG